MWSGRTLHRSESGSYLLHDQPVRLHAVRERARVPVLDGDGAAHPHRIGNIGRDPLTRILGQQVEDEDRAVVDHIHIDYGFVHVLECRRQR